MKTNVFIINVAVRVIICPTVSVIYVFVPMDSPFLKTTSPELTESDAIVGALVVKNVFK